MSVGRNVLYLFVFRLPFVGVIIIFLFPRCVPNYQKTPTVNSVYIEHTHTNIYIIIPVYR